MMNKKQREEIEYCAIESINRYDDVDEHDDVSDCGICDLISSQYCSNCPFYEYDKGLTCRHLNNLWDCIGVYSRTGAKKSNKKKWQKELFKRYNKNAKRLGLTELVWLKEEV